MVPTRVAPIIGWIIGNSRYKVILQVSVSATKRKLFADNLNPQSIINDSNKHVTELKESSECSGKW